MTKPCKKCSLPRYANSSWCKTHHFEREQEKKLLKAEKLKQKKEKKKIKKAESPKRLKAALDKVFSEYIRRKFSTNGLTICVTCFVKKPWQELQAGHYVGRAHLNTRWDIRNVRPQCFRCNCWLKGNYPAYTKHFLEVYDGEWLQQLISDGKKIRKWTTLEMKAEIEKFTELLKSL